VNPSVLNGCQTIKSAYFFYQEAVSKNKLDEKIWNKIPVSIRIVATDEKELWREVAEANNRQNSMSAAALRANDEIQITLENRFKDLGIF
ncbi:AIPR family protein, partial [Acinetobacter baumannii]|uniref:AIPR family protein n=1 Tax=Acinetobacter baumannii TaxID=470 RepID=UPI0037D7443F